MILHQTIQDGEKAVKWYDNGNYEIVKGPKVITSFFARLETMQAFKAEPDEYLAIHYADGRCEHRCGPDVEWLDPVKHTSIEIKKLININANEAIVIYRDVEREVTRRVVRGPALLMLEANEWIHNFQWHGSVAKADGRKKPGALKFLKLRVIPDQLYFDVEDVRTTDEAMLTLKLMVFFELDNIEVMLDKTHDPIADFINALTADIISFAGKGTFEEFKGSTEGLNDLSAYPQLTGRANKIGYKITKVVYRGYKANARLQEMHDQAIEARTSLLLQSETEEQIQQLADLKLKKEIEREKLANEQEKLRNKHKEQLKKSQHENDLAMKSEVREEELRLLKQQHELELKKLCDENQQKLQLWNSMRECGADLTKVLVAENRNPDKMIAIQGAAETQYHLHENE